ncbi:SGNH/GDSL hydrolase family protein [Sutcliffiella horikoshii]|uniref:SGNH/GDSL hydrolase family protein n=1 Tax=Sutcliffiella horikoshii TaxID=79883 RepID=UPI003CEB4921
MRAILTLVVLICIGALVYGNYHWIGKLASAVGKEEAQFLYNVDNTNELESGEKELTVEDFSNLPIDNAKFIMDKYNRGEAVELVLIGSEYKTAGVQSWSGIFKDEIEQTYKILFNITIIELSGEVTTEDVINNDLINKNLSIIPDIVILEPFLLDSNGIIGIERSLEHVETMIEDVKLINSDVFVFLQPAQPIHKAIYYPDEVAKLQSMAEDQEIFYIDHWTDNWPDYNSDEFLEYIIPDTIIPNQKGHQIWADYIMGLFKNEET